MNISRILDRITFKMETKYQLKFLTAEAMKLFRRTERK